MTLRQLTFVGVLRSEWTKLFSLRAPVALLAVMAFLPVALALVRSAAAPPLEEASQQDGVRAALESVALGGLPVAFIAAALGLIAMGSEYGSGYAGESLASTFIASPRRRLVVLAKCGPVAAASFVATLFGLGLGSGFAVVVLGRRGYTGLPIDQLVGIAVAGAVSAGLLGVLGVACAALARSSVSTALHLAALLALAPSALALAGSKVQIVSDLLPATAVQAAVTRATATPFPIEGALPSTLPWWGGLLVLSGWAAVYLCLALVLISRRTIASAQAGGRPRTAPSRPDAALTPTGATFRGVLRSELLKFATLPAARWLLGISVVAIVGLAAARGSSSPAEAVAAGVGLVQLLFAFLGAIAVTSEFTSGNIQPTVLAVPQRSRLLLAKVAVVAAASLIVSFVAFTIAAVLVSPPQGLLVLMPTVLRCVLIMTAVSVLGCAIGMLVRGPIASIAVIVTVFVLAHAALGPLQFATQGTPLVWVANADDFFPSAVIAVQIVPENVYWPLMLVGNVLQLSPDLSLLAIVAWAVLGMALGLAVFRRRGI